MPTLTLVKPNLYHDSVALLALARRIRSGAGIREAAALMGTAANKALLAQSGLLTPEADSARPGDLVVVIQAESAAAATYARTEADEFFAGLRQEVERAARPRPRTLEAARRQLPGATLALISVPGSFAAVLARKALRLGLSAMLFSDNVAVEDEIALKRLALERGLLLMGPDCGTAYLGGVPLGFTNRVPRGRVGIVAASGTGLQQVAVLLAARGEGISQAIGVGGRDMSAAVEGLMTLAALDALGADAATELIVVIGKPPAPAVRERVAATLRSIGKPAVIAMLGREVEAGRHDRIVTVANLEDAARAAVATLRDERFVSEPFSLSRGEVSRRVEAARRRLFPGQAAIRGLYAGGTLAHEAALILEPLLGAVASNLGARGDGIHRVVDLGADEFTVGRAHPMLDPTARVTAIRSAAEDPAVGVLLLDVVLGYGAAPDPAGDIAPAIEEARALRQSRGGDLAVVASVIGAEGDPQGLGRQVERLEEAGAWVLPSNAQAARASACIAGGEPVMQTLLGARRG